MRTTAKLLSAATACLLVLGVCGRASATSPDSAKPQTELKQIRSRIEAIRQQIQSNTEQRDVASTQLRDAELKMQSARQNLNQVRARRQVSEAKLAALKAERGRIERQIGNERQLLARELRLAYINGRAEQFKLILNQADTATLGRMLVYYTYFGRVRAERIRDINDELAHLDLITESIAAETERLKGVEQEHSQQVQTLAEARKSREQILASIGQTLKSRNDELAKLQHDAAALERLVEQLRRAAEEFPLLAQQPFEQVKGKLPWPVKGAVAARFGQPRSGAALKWQGIVIRAPQGAQVRAPFYGRVVYADWLPGLGRLLIIDHGRGYMSLYGHNEQLFVAAGDMVQPGDVIAAVGDTGGQNQPGLYIEIRKGKEPLDPLAWLANRESAHE